MCNENLNQEILLYKLITSNQKLRIVFAILSTSLCYYTHVVEARVITYKHHRLIHHLIVDIIALLICYFSVRIDRYTFWCTNLP
ncbi:hypothetical protein GLOIN_2v324232 [Rhizophagus irregularis DAOM 181602=DAOM 197198]|uniref:Uncharacterized protein n=1 Tax=Rhizophagus irregularis (strain DAOM 181602 / DAOM 197198 / MUCL 43194) TaxID=747089 RepID=A0A2P4QRW8_RHIID|nr:hypothetical protein GLOIN_2v324232 [Rhizophagus irregularis DAOM 181602=DAOM 197198]POG80409.1 hypothetical protein GLOIN_2v324232 [Rhizophagus irregularis DAOM 181602=DAOM 197198]|eukprot:XP_025187275.1 hypothetical protein GLOIN_2v324232 [Rhizophagus irregularis DAOM 181602=DAOM 197198]